ncbi:FtsJ-like methyltransferase [Rhizoctonia solani]|uniref:FtsJ-like methyltransferase n=1 Tax=Rhizoctonia solani TaxID=456999 RepID=A0A8H7IA74_9AGAM|nr:FtsJ-like methyltransferase [Rhizoctonia solani]
MFRDQFYTAFSDMVEDLGPRMLACPNPTTGAARFVRRFADLGCAPGGFAQYLLTTFPQCTGVGVTHPDGYTMTYQGWTNGCSSDSPWTTRGEQHVHFLRSPSFAWLYYARPGGTLILVSSANPNVFCLEILALIRRLFASEVRSTKGRKLHEIRSAYYIVGQGYKGANADVLRQLDEAIRTLKRRGAMGGASDWVSEDDDDVAYTGEAIVHA